LNCATDFAYANEEECFAVAESTCGLLTKPAAANRVYSVGPAEINQEREFIEDGQIRASASKFASIVARKNPGDWSFNAYVKPSGALGTVPEHGLLYRCLLGTQTPTPATKVEYTLASQLDSFSLWIKKGHTVFAGRGCTVEQGEFTVPGNEIATTKFTGKLMEMKWAGEVVALDTCGIGKQVITLSAGGAQMYCIGMFVEVGTDDNGAAGYELTDVNYTNDTITLHTTLLTNQGVNPTIYPWWPTAAAEFGTPGHGKQGIVTIGGANAVVMSATVTIVNNIKYYIDEKNGLWTAEQFGRPGKRAVSGNLNMFFLKRGPSYFYRSDYRITNALVIPVGNVAGKIMEITVPYAEYRSSKLSGNEEFMQDIPFEAIASASMNDEVKVTFK